MTFGRIRGHKSALTAEQIAATYLAEEACQPIGAKETLRAIRSPNIKWG